jgi:hypothetical protein
LRARDYYDAIERGALNTRIADAQVVTAKKVASFPQERRRFRLDIGQRVDGEDNEAAN